MNYKEEAIRKIEEATNVKQIKEIVSWLVFDSYNRGDDYNNEGYELLKMVSENANDFTKDIADKFIEKYENYESDLHNEDDEVEISLSEKQQWCIAYQVFNNKNVYTTK